MPYAYSASSVDRSRAFELACYFLLQPLLWMLGLTRLFMVGRRLNRGGRPRNRPVRILLVEPFQMGDVLSLGALFDPLKRAFPDCEISILTQEKNAEIFRLDPRVHKTVAAPFPWAAYSGKRGNPGQWLTLLQRLILLGLDGYDLGIDTRGEVRNQIMLVLTECRERLGSSNYMASNMVIRGLFLTHNAGNLPYEHRTLMNLRLLASYLGEESLKPEYPLLKVPGLAPERPVQVRGEAPLVCFHIGGGSKYKRWPAERWTGLAQALLEHTDAELVFIAGPGERAEVDEIATTVPSPRVHVEETSMESLIKLLLAADLLICLDSGPMNLASALNKRVLALFGPGDSRIWAPQSAGSAFLDAQPDTPSDPDFETKAAKTGENPTALIPLEDVRDLALKMLAAPPKFSQAE